MGSDCSCGLFSRPSANIEGYVGIRHHFVGDEALAYVRSRHLRPRLPNGKWGPEDPASDLARISRQQDFLRRVLQRALDKGLFDPKVARALIESLQKFHYYYGDDFTVECPTGSGRQATLGEVADELGGRLARLFLKGSDGQRPVLKLHPKLATDPHFRDHVLFFEYFHGDTGRGVGASHQTGWTGVVARLAQLFASTDAAPVLAGASRPLTVPYRPPEA